MITHCDNFTDFELNNLIHATITGQKCEITVTFRTDKQNVWNLLLTRDILTEFMKNENPPNNIAMRLSILSQKIFDNNT